MADQILALAELARKAETEHEKARVDQKRCYCLLSSVKSVRASSHRGVCPCAHDQQRKRREDTVVEDLDRNKHGVSKLLEFSRTIVGVRGRKEHGAHIERRRGLIASATRSEKRSSTLETW